MHLSISDLSLELRFLLLFFIVGSLPTQAQLNKSDWKSTQQLSSFSEQAEVLKDGPKHYLISELEVEKVLPQMKSSQMNVWLPEPNGEFSEYILQPTQVVAEEVQKHYSIKTYRGIKKDDPTTIIACDISAEGLHAAVFQGSETYYIEPYASQHKAQHIVYYKKDVPHHKVKCGVHDHVEELMEQTIRPQLKAPGVKTTFRLALVAAGEFSLQFGGTPYSTTNVLDALASGVNIINTIYLRDIGIDFTLVSTPALVFPDPAIDPFDLSNDNQLLDDCQETCFVNLGVNGFDIGHLVIWSNPSGLASFGVVCNDSSKGYGYSSFNGSVSGLWVDYVCHEIGHQFNARHNFAARECQNSTNGFRFEPGEGSSIMSYANVCGAPVQYAQGSDPFFHYASINRIQEFVLQDGTNCGVTSGGTNTDDPRSDAGTSIIIPQNTPFALVGYGEDATDSLSLSYHWEQYDGDSRATTGLPDCADPTQPLFRFRPPVAEPYRSFPSYDQVLLGLNNAVDFEKLPCIERTMTFSLAVRDNNISFGRITHDTMVVTVANTGPFELSSPNGGELLTGGAATDITWNVNNTDTHCPLIDVLVSTDGGVEYTVIANAIPNTGTASVIIPNIASTDARMLIRCDVPGGFREGSTFYDVCDDSFMIDGATLPDLDGDGYDNTVDCDDLNPMINPGAPEICNGIDDDCDGLIDDLDPNAVGLTNYYMDVDGDGYGDPSTLVTACTAPTGFITDGTDCNDTNPMVNPAATEICNGFDDDCDGLIDQADPSLSGSATWYLDADGDGYGDSNISTTNCTPPVGYVALDGDCNDNNANINPGATEVCNGIDDDCDGLVDQADPNLVGNSIWYPDVDGDSFGSLTGVIISCTQPIGYVAMTGDCNDNNPNINPLAQEICNGFDDDCDGLVDGNDPSVTGAFTWYADIDGDGFGNPSSALLACTQPAGYVINNTDCNDSNIFINPSALEVCNGIDDDCDGLIDQADPSLTGTLTWYADTDGDGYGNPALPIQSCSQPAGYVSNNGDCNDSSASINPSAQEICNNIDDDCDGLIDGQDPSLVGGAIWYLDADLDGFGDPVNSITSCNPPQGYVNNNIDCDDSNQNVSPSAIEVCNGIDDDCDGLIDQADPSVTGLTTWYADLDGDNYGNPQNSVNACSQPTGFVLNNGDCNDGDPAINPDSPEICNNLDDDCDGLIDGLDSSLTGTSIWYRDSDLDGYGNPNQTVLDCTQPQGHVSNNLDCDDNNSAVNPAAQEICNGIDDDCDGLIDSDDPSNTGTSTWYADNDGDGYGDPTNTLMSCTQPLGYINNNTDCNDTNPLINPGGQEVCNGFDDDCDGLVDSDDPDNQGDGIWYQDVDNDGFGNTQVVLSSCVQPTGYSSVPGDCNDNNPAVNPAQNEICNNIDDDCDGLVDDADPDLNSNTIWFLDADGDGYGTTLSSISDCTQPAGYVANNTDCNDNNANVNPGAAEICNGMDDDCDGLIDSDDPDAAGTVTTWYLDNDGDGFGDLATELESCTQPQGYVFNATDCNDNNSAIFPGAPELCNGLDDDCDGLLDGADPDLQGGEMTYYQDNDSDGFGNGAVSVQACTPPAGYVLNNTDCDDTNGSVNPSAQEVCNGIDDDCNGLIDIDDPNIAGVGLWFADLDMDGFGDANNTVLDCSQPDGYTFNNEDCDDTNAAINPDAIELCNDIDDNCDGLIDDADPTLDGLVTYYADQDGDGFGDPDRALSACEEPSGFVENDQDCDDTNPDVNPAIQEVPNNGIDDDCDGQIDDMVSTLDLTVDTWAIYPNPARAFMHINGAIQTGVDLKLFSIQGQLLESKTNISLPNKIDIRNLAEGTYILELQHNDEKIRSVHKIIKMH